MRNPATVELSNYFRAVAQIAAENRKDTPDLDLVEDALSELEAIALHTENPTLRVKCQAVLAQQPTAAKAAAVP